MGSLVRVVVAAASVLLLLPAAGRAQRLMELEGISMRDRALPTRQSVPAGSRNAVVGEVVVRFVRDRGILTTEVGPQDRFLSLDAAVTNEEWFLSACEQQAAFWESLRR